MNKIRKIAVVFLLGIFTIIYAGTSFSEITFNGAFAISTYRLLKWRRERDSNPRNLSAQLFSRQPHSATLPSLHA